MDRSHVVIAFLSGVCLALGTALMLQSGDALPRAHAQSASGGGEMFAVTGTGYQGQSKDALFIVDSRSQRLAVYEYNNRKLTLACVRNMEYDLLFQEFSNPKNGQQDPSVAEMRKAQNNAGGKKKRRTKKR